MNNHSTIQAWGTKFHVSYNDEEDDVVQMVHDGWVCTLYRRNDMYFGEIIKEWIYEQKLDILRKLLYRYLVFVPDNKHANKFKSFIKGCEMQYGNFFALLDFELAQARDVIAEKKESLRLELSRKKGSPESHKQEWTQYKIFGEILETYNRELLKRGY